MISERRSIGRSHFVHKLNFDTIIAGLEVIRLKIIVPTQYFI